MADEINGLTVKVGITSDLFTQGIGKINKSMNLLRSEFKASSSSLNNFGSDTDKLANRQNFLNRSMELQKAKIDALKQAYDKSKTSTGEFSNATQTAGTKLNNAIAYLNKMQGELNDLDKELAESNKNLKTHSGLVSKIGKDYKESFDQAKQSAGNFFDTTKRMGQAITGIGAGIAAGLGFTVKAAADNETQLAKMETAMQGNTKAAQEYVAWAKEFGKTTPFEANEVVDATIKLKSYGLEAKNVLTPIGNMAAGMGKGLDQAIEAVADSQQGELERLKEFGITKAQLIDQAAKMGKGEIVNAKGQITNQAALNDALFALMEQRFKNGMKRQSETLQGQISAIKDTFSQLAGDIGTALLPTVKIFASFIQQLADGFGKLSPQMRTTIAIGGALAAGFALIAGPLLIIIGLLPTMAAGLAILMSPITLIVAGIGVLIGAFVALYNNNATFRENVNQTWTQIQTTISTIIENLKVIFSIFAQVAQQIWSQHGSQIMAIINAAWSNISAIVNTALNIISNILKIVTGIMSGNWSQVWEGMKGLLSSVWNGIISIVGSGVNLIKSVISGGFGALHGIVSSIFGGIKNLITSPIREAADFIGTQIQRIKNFFSGLSLKLPHIDLPHFKINGKLSLNPPSIPSIGVDWYAKGGIFNSPQVVGVGDASSPEAVVPLDKLQGFINNAVQKNNNPSSNGKQPMIVKIVLQNGKELAEYLLDDINDLQAKQADIEGRNRGYDTLQFNI